MKDKKLHESITLACPNGHRLRAAANFVGKTVKCPRCQAVFAISEPAKKQVSDTAVMRILGEGPSGEMTPPEPLAANSRPCPRCGVAIPDDSTVCEHCKCYVGLMPRYMVDLMSDRQTGEAS